ncbi:hypothetical protein COV16_01675 [Candidatus Woesearchaeota archaeon CG10_big_fil_rev_8_21_14_0_10_34_8]|nr:MAG: hypothetical protein COV16_01675 [Candidatus Woesearchaeota archaeon CG10_big_fil_rev_8_21_14_0_10_34_8]
MISAKLMKSLEKEGFSLELPLYKSRKEQIIELLKEKNNRLELALPILLQHQFEYDKITKKLDKNGKKILDRNIIIAKTIFQKESIECDHLRKIIKEEKLHYKIPKEEFTYYYDSFKDAQKKIETEEENTLKKQINIRGKLYLNKALSTIYSPGKCIIMEKIFNHEKLTNTELKYYYRSIRPLILAILNENIQEYLSIIESTKKYSK